MKAWFFANWGTIVISLLLLSVVSLILLNLRNKKKQGKTSCGCDCAHCAMGGSCHQK